MRKLIAEYTHNVEGRPHTYRLVVSLTDEDLPGSALRVLEEVLHVNALDEPTWWRNRGTLDASVVTACFRALCGEQGAKLDRSADTLTIDLGQL
jgi:hypothetical protein